MPGMVAFRRRWSVGSDDLVVPALFLVILHTSWWVCALGYPLIDFCFVWAVGRGGGWMLEGINMLNEIQPWPCELACCPIDPFVNCCTEVVLHLCGVCYQHNNLWSPKECLRLGIKCCHWHYWVSGTSPPAPAMPDDKYSSVENCAGHLVPSNHTGSTPGST